MDELPSPARHLPDIVVCECTHLYMYHNRAAELGENLVIEGNCNACGCKKFIKSVEKTQREILRWYLAVQRRQKEAEMHLAGIQNELEQLQTQCEHPFRKSDLEYDATNYKCSDCGKHWAER